MKSTGWIVCASAVMLSTGAQAQVRPGSYSGTMVCAVLPNTIAPVRAAVRLDITGSTVNFTRQVFDPQGRRQIGTERGTGNVGQDGALTIRSSWRGRRDSMTGSYSGTATSSGATLSGETSWTIEGRTYSSRSCSATLRRQ